MSWFKQNSSPLLLNLTYKEVAALVGDGGLRKFNVVLIIIKSITRLLFFYPIFNFRLFIIIIIIILFFWKGVGVKLGRL